MLCMLSPFEAPLIIAVPPRLAVFAMFISVVRHPAIFDSHPLLSLDSEPDFPTSDKSDAIVS